MERLSFRLDDDLYDRVLDRARANHSNPSAYLRALVQRFEGHDPTGFHDRFDELHATCIQTLAILAAYVAGQAPQALAKGMEDARALLIERGLMDASEAPSSGAAR